MKNTSGKGKKISRRGVLPLIGGTLLVPFLGFGKSNDNEPLSSDEDDEYQILLKPDGTSVKVKTSTIKKAKTVEQKMSNKSLHNWLSKKF